MYQLIGFIQRKSKPHIFITGGNFATQSKVSTEFRLLSCHRFWKLGLLSLLMFVLQRDGSLVSSERHAQVRKVTRGQLTKDLSSLKNDLYVFQRDKKANALRKGRREKSLSPFSTGRIKLLIFNLYLFLHVQLCGKKNHYLVSQLSANKICNVNVYLWVLRPCAIFITLTRINVSYELSS